MATGRRTANYRQRGGSGINRGQFYVYGNTVRQAEVLPERVPEKKQNRQNRTSRQVRRNRNRAMAISPAYAVFLTAAAVCAVMVCVLYLSLQSDVVSRSKNITALQEKLAEMTEANDTAYSAAADSINLETVREKAMNEMGMVYEAEGNVIEYKSPTSDYVRQYSSIPEDGVLAQSRDASK